MARKTGPRPRINRPEACIFLIIQAKYRGFTGKRPAGPGPKGTAIGPGRPVRPPYGLPNGSHSKKPAGRSRPSGAIPTLDFLLAHFGRTAKKTAVKTHVSPAFRCVVAGVCVPVEYFWPDDRSPKAGDRRRTSIFCRRQAIWPPQTDGKYRFVQPLIDRGVAA